MDVREIEREMHRLSCGETSYETVMRLAALKVVHDHLTEPDARPQQDVQPTAPASAPSVWESEFVAVMSQVPFDRAVQILAEHMDILQEVCPREYDRLMRELWRLK